MSRDDAYLLDIIAAAAKIDGFVSGLTKEEFNEDERTQLAVLHLLMTIGEAARRLSDGFRSAHADLPFRSAIALRNIVVHQYDSVDLEIVWNTVTDEIPKLAAALHLIMNKGDPDDSSKG